MGKTNQVKPTSLEVPSWVPLPVTHVAQELFGQVVYTPTEHIGKYVSTIRRLATDPRMNDVWVELRRRQGGAAHGGDYVHPACEKALLGHDAIGWLSSLTHHLPRREQPQAQAAGILFIEAARFFLFDQRHPFGPRARARREIDAEVKQFLDLANQSERLSARSRAAGLGRYGFERLESDCRERVKLLQSRGPDPYLVERRSERLGDDWLRGFIITMSGLCNCLFKERMYGVVAILANVAFERTDLTAARVRAALPVVKQGERDH